MVNVIAVILLIFFTSLALARGPAGTLSVPTFSDDGEISEPISVDVGSSSAVDLFEVVKTTMIAKRVRSILIQNPSATYDLLVGTTSNFMSLSSPSFWFVPKDSGAWITTNKSNKYLQYPVGAKTETIRGNVESE